MKALKPVRSVNLDANESIFFARDLEKIKSRTYDKLYPELKARRFVPAAEDPAGTGDNTVTYRQWDRVGMAKVIADYAHDLPRVNALGKEFSSPLRSLGAMFGYSLQEVRAAAAARRSLPAMLASNARESIEEKIDEIIAIGDSVNGLPGFLTNPNVPQASVVGGTWATKIATDPDLILDDIADMYGDMIDLTNGRHRGNMLLLPESQYALVSTTRLVDQPVTVLKFLREVYPGLMIDSWYRLKGAGSGGTDRMVMYTRSADRLWYEVPQEFEMLNVQEHSLEFEVPCHARVGGTIIPYPLSVSYRDGI